VSALARTSASKVTLRFAASLTSAELRVDGDDELARRLRVRAAPRVGLERDSSMVR